MICARHRVRKGARPYAGTFSLEALLHIYSAAPAVAHCLKHRCSRILWQTEQEAQAVAAAAEQGDCVLTKDGHLVMRHEPNLSNTTNADDLFPDRSSALQRKRCLSHLIDFQLTLVTSDRLQCHLDVPA